jgi:uncharacterized peroxidase-related enzyme
MKPMFLPGVENNPQPSPYADLIQAAHTSNAEYTKIWHLLAFKPRIAHHLVALTHELMHEPAPLTPAFRELIAAYTSQTNACEFCAKSHAGVSAELYGDDALVAAVRKNLETSPLPEKEKAMLRFAAKLTKSSGQMVESDVLALRHLGWTDEEIFYAISVTALFNFYNRWISASGIEPTSDESHSSRAKLMAKTGYMRK